MIVMNAELIGYIHHVLQGFDVTFIDMRTDSYSLLAAFFNQVLTT